MIAIGVRGLLSKLIHGSAPKWATESREAFEVWITPSLPQWDHLPTGPYRLIRADLSSADVYDYVEFGAATGQLARAVARFATNCLPRKGGDVCVLLDDASLIILGWFTEGDKLRWGGCQHGFTLLAAVMDNEPSIVLWEADARAGHDRQIFGRIIDE